MEEQIKIGDRFIDNVEGNNWTVVDVSDSSITLEDEYGIPTTYPDHFNDGDFFDWFA